MKPPSLAQWMMDAFNDAYGPDTWAGEWSIREDHNDALLSLSGKNGRSADVWVEWVVRPQDKPPHDTEVTVSIVTEDGVTNEIGPFAGTPQELAAWLKGAA